MFDDGMSRPRTIQEFVALERAEAEKKRQEVWSLERLKDALALELTNEDYPKNIAQIIRQISAEFSRATTDGNPEECHKALAIIENHASYLGEKMHDTQGQRDYMEVVRRAVKYLKEKESVPDSVT